MARAEPEGFSLEGNLLAFIFNPVFVDDSSGARRKGFTAFGAGGMAVFESSRPNETFLDFWLDARVESATLRTVVRESVAGGERVAILRTSVETQFLADIAAKWFQQAQVTARRRRALGRLPQSFKELRELLDPDETPLDESAFYDWLRAG